MRLSLTPVLFAAAMNATLLAGPAAAAPDQTQGVAILAAFVDADGTLIRGVGVESSERDTGGQYFVTFNRNINDCFVLPGSGDRNIVVSSEVTKDEQIIVVRGVDRNGILTDGEFNVLVFCAR